ncbi:macrophage mannose receptor 1-like [Haliotis asinina]|uniref:macrophage mannose receptor 1-like n=1 Tax=Haliotis asinina TaxID=109174 RepID=UPI003531EBCB
MNDYIYDLDANLCFQVYTGYALSFDNAQYMCNYLTGGAGGLASLSTTKKFKAVQHFLRDKRKDGTYFWVGSEQSGNWDYHSFYYYVYYYYYGWVNKFHFYDYNYWSDSHKVDYKLWASGEPSGNYEQCNAITRRKNLELMDSKCSYKFDYICDIPVLEPDRPWQCDSDYVFHRESKLCFKIVHLKANAYQAQDKCSSDGYGRGRLAVLNTMEKFNHVKEHLIELGETRPYLVGATQTSMWWEWNEWNDGTLVNSAVWAHGEPSSIYEDCADLRREMGYKLNDVSCSYRSLYFICDIPI